MRAQTVSVVLALVIALVAHAGAPTNARLLPELPDFWLDGRVYRVDPFIRAAVTLQDLGRSAALEAMRSMAEERDNAARISVLCRMLFKPRANSTMRAPFIGAPEFLDGTSRVTNRDPIVWPLEPIEIVDGIPFLIVDGYMMAGQGESAKGYLQYCESNGEWSEVRYRVPTGQEKRGALTKLLASPKWRAPLGEAARSFLMDQIR